MLEDFCGPHPWGPRKSGTHICAEVLARSLRAGPECAARPGRFSDLLFGGWSPCAARCAQPSATQRDAEG
jgi:hypothetical protein